MNKKVLEIAIIANVMPTYREGFYSRLFASKDMFVTVYCQESIPGSNLRTIHGKFPNNVKIIRSFTAKGEKIAWQFIPWKECLFGYDVVFVQGNPRYLSHAILATLMRVLQKKIVLWTMAHSYRANKYTEAVRLYWSRIFRYLLVYSDSEVDYLRKIGFKTPHIIGMNNGLDQNVIDKAIRNWSDSHLESWRKKEKLSNKLILLSCSRLGPKNKFHHFIESLDVIVKQFPNLLWCVIGCGLEQAKLESCISDANLSEHVRFVGEMYNEHELAPWFLSSRILIHPAAIGLSLLHAFAYGLPVITHGNSKHHGPEFGAFENGITGCSFIEDDIADLSCTVIKLLENDELLNTMSNYVKKITREKYNVDIMVQRFMSIAQIASEN